MPEENDASLLARFGRVVHAHRDLGPYIGRNGVAVSRVLDLLDEGLNYNQVCSRIPGLSIKDVMACRAYRVRFLEKELMKAYAGDDKSPYFLLDENTSYLLLPEIYRLFGPSTSVLAEGLFFQNNDDEANVWQFARDNGYKAILTQDSDFRAIAKKHGQLSLREPFSAAAMPKIIMIQHGLSVRGMTDLLRRHRDAIDQAVHSPNRFATYRVAPHGVLERDPLERVLQAA